MIYLSSFAQCPPLPQSTVGRHKPLRLRLGTGSTSASGMSGTRRRGPYEEIGRINTLIASCPSSRPAWRLSSGSEYWWPRRTMWPPPFRNDLRGSTGRHHATPLRSWQVLKLPHATQELDEVVSPYFAMICSASSCCRYVTMSRNWHVRSW